MKILILSHTRCGSTTFCKWLSNELNMELDETPYNKTTFDFVFEKTNIIRKIVIEEYFPNNDIIDKFDKVICLSRENTIDTSISFIIANNTDIWHGEYNVTSEWLEENKNQIIEQKYLYDYLKNKLKKIKGLHITYEHIYINKIDIVNVINYLNIQKPKHLNMIDCTKKYRKDIFKFEHDFTRKNII